MKDFEKFYNGKTILVTGGAGSIGSEIVRSLLKLEPHAVRILDINETGLFDLEQELQSPKIRTFIGDVRDKDRLKRAFEDVDIVFHAAALKHVPLCEYNPFDAVKTNVIGTQNVIDSALDEEVKKVILISTDKAVNPTNVMGATKLLSERLVISANHYKGKRQIAFSCVRFGNVMDSRGSVIPLFRSQIKKGGPVKVTDPNMTRFVMSIPNAVDLILKAAYMSKGGEIFILKMPALRIIDLAEVMIDGLEPKNSRIEIQIIGKRAGEKLYEELLTEDKVKYAVEKGGLYVLASEGILARSENEIKIYTSSDAKKLSKEEIMRLIKDNHVI